MTVEDIINNAEKIVITDICTQKNDPNRFSVFLNDKFAFGISIDTYDEFKLKTNQELSAKDVEEILKFENRYKARTDALRYISYQMRTEFEVRRKLQRKGYDADVINDTLSELVNRKYINDNEFAAGFARDFVKFKKDGGFKLKSKLQSRGVASEIITAVSEQYITPEVELEKALQQAEKKMKLIREKANPKEKVYRFLIQKGFENAIVSQVLDKIFKNG